MNTSQFQNKNIKKSVAIVVMLFFLFLAFRYFFNFKEQKTIQHNNYHFSAEELEKIQSGDIILRKGYGFVSNLIDYKMQRAYSLSHCAIIVKDTLTNQFKVIHTVSSTLSDTDGMQIENLNQFVAESVSKTIVVLRYKGNNNHQISTKAREYLKQKIPFDHSFDMQDSTKFYCTELVYRVIKATYNDEIEHQNNYLNFDSFLDTTRFKIIINHQADKFKN